MRLAYFFIRRFGHSALTLGYSIAASDLVLAPFVPSDTARGGGIIYPITRSLAQVFHSEPGPTAGRLGAFLILVGYHATYTSSGMFLTSMAANPLIAEFALKIAHVELTWMRWALGAAVPGHAFAHPGAVSSLSDVSARGAQYGGGAHHGDAKNCTAWAP